MRRIFLCCALLALWAVVAGAQTSNATTTDAEKKLIDLEHRWSDADARGDVSAEGNILAPDFYETTAEGRVKTRDQVLTELGAHRESDVSEIADEMKVRLYGSTAIVIGRFTRLKSGRTILRGRFTDVFVRRDNQWLAVSNHWSSTMPCRN